MAISPAHKFGQDLGNLLETIVLEKILKPRLEKIANANKFYLDSQIERPVRKGKKISWADQYGNHHDLDFVIEKGGTPEKLGTPVAFVEAAWRRYTKHSKNKAQEIQGAILPIVARHQLSAPFCGVVLAGEFSEPSLVQLRNNNFYVLHILYKNVIEAFLSIGFDISFNEKTSDDKYVLAIKRFLELSDDEKDVISNALIKLSCLEIKEFMDALQNSLERNIIKILLIPLFGTEVRYASIDSALNGMKNIDSLQGYGKLQKIEIVVDYSNGDSIRASFTTAKTASLFLRGL